MADKYRKKGQLDFYEKEKKSNLGTWVFWGFVALVLIGLFAG